MAHRGSRNQLNDPIVTRSKTFFHFFQPFSYVSMLMTALMLGAGCGQKQEAPKALTSKEIPQAIREAFKEAGPEIKEEISRAVVHLEKQNDVEAFLQLQEMSSKPDLTPEQRSVVARSLIGVSQRLQTSAASGNAQAEELLKVHRASK